MASQQAIAKKFDHGLSSISGTTVQLQHKIDSVHHELVQLTATVTINSPILAQKEAELKALRAQLHSIQTQKPYTGYYDAPSFSSHLPPLPSYSQPLSILSPHDHNPFNSAAFLPIKQQEISQSSKRKPVHSPKESPTRDPPQPPSQMMMENPISFFLTKMAKQSQSENKQSHPKNKPASLWKKCTDDSDDDSMSLEVLMADPTDGPTVEDEDIFTQGFGIPEEEQPSPFQNDPSKGFSFDNTPPSSWRDRTMSTVADKFVAKFHGRLRQWWIALGAYRQLIVKQSPNVDTLIMHPEDLPPHVKDKILSFVLQKISLMNLLAFQKIYIRRYSLSEGPFQYLPLHPKFPFLTILWCNAKFHLSFPKEAYMFLWYFVETCPFGMIFDKGRLLQYFAITTMKPCKKKYKQLYKWLTLFGDATFWQENLRPQGNSLNGVREQTYIFIHFECKRTIEAVEDGVIIHREYSCTFWHNREYAAEPGIEHKALMCTLNNVLFTDVPLGMPYEYWQHPQNLPPNYVKEIQDCQFKLEIEAITTDEQDTDHPDFRLLKRTPYRVYKRLPGLGYSVPVSSGSEDDED
ncbi:hypothetical protein ACET3Z_000701 [Daucus carota]